MKNASLFLLTLLLIGGAAIAQNEPVTEIRESTDPNKIAEVERRAQEIAEAAQQQEANPPSSGASSGPSTAPETKASKPRKKIKKGKAQSRTAA